MKALPRICIFVFSGLTILNLKAQLFELETEFDDGLFTYSFLDGFYPLTFGVSKGSGAIDFMVPDATQVTVPDDWVVCLLYTSPSPRD